MGAQNLKEYEVLRLTIRPLSHTVPCYCDMKMCLLALVSNLTFSQKLRLFGSQSPGPMIILFVSVRVYTEVSFGVCGLIALLSFTHLTLMHV
jgi:hypothetical protein